MKTTTIFIIAILTLALSACSSPAKKCPPVEKVMEDSLITENNPKIDYSSDQATMNLSSYEAVQYWKKKMNARLEAIKKLYEKKDWMEPIHKTRFFKNLEAAQSAFEAYLTAQVELQYPKAEEDEWWGSGIPPCINLIYIKHYKNRYTELGLWEQGSPDGEMCGGSALTSYEIGEMGKRRKNYCYNLAKTQGKF
jgi:hypothetical protein